MRMLFTFAGSSSHVEPLIPIARATWQPDLFVCAEARNLGNGIADYMTVRVR